MPPGRKSGTDKPHYPLRRTRNGNHSTVQVNTRRVYARPVF
jgi:hypothetical protein